MSKGQRPQSKPFFSTQHGLKAALFGIFAADEFNKTRPWTQFALVLVAPLFIMGYIVQAGLEIAKTYYAKNKNYLRALNISTSLGYAGVALTIGLSILLTTNPYAAFFWYFLSLSAVTYATAQSVISLCYHALQAWLAPTGSMEAKDFLQSMYKDLFQLGLSFLTLLTMYHMPGPGSDTTSVAYLVGCGAIASLSIAGMTWEVLSQPLKNQIKSWFGAEKPTQDMSPIKDLSHTKVIAKQLANSSTQATNNDIQLEATAKAIPASNASVLFRRYRKATVMKHIDAPQQVKDYLLTELSLKLNSYGTAPTCQRDIEKCTALQEIKDLMSQGQKSATIVSTIEKMLANNTALHQSFFAHTSDTVDLLQAVKCFYTFGAAETIDPEPVIMNGIQAK